MKNISQNDIVVKLSLKFSIPEGRIKVLLCGQHDEISKLESVIHLKQCYRLYHPLSYEAFSIRYRWNELSMCELTNAKDLKAINQVLLNAPSLSNAEVDSIKRANNLINMIDPSSRIVQRLEKFENTLRESESYFLLLEKWILFLLISFNRNIPRIGHVSRKSSLGGALGSWYFAWRDINRLVIENMLTLATIPGLYQYSDFHLHLLMRHIKSISSLDEISTFFQQATNLVLKHMAWRRWQEISYSLYVKISDIRQAQELFSKAPPYSEVKYMAVEKWFKLSTTMDDYIKLFKILPIGNPLELEILKKMNRLV